MRKRFILLCVCGFLGITAFATEITEQEALKKAQHFMAGKKFIRKAANRRASSNKQRAFYVFNVQEKGGFVIVSGDDRTPDILGYADKGALDVENAPCNVKWLLSCYEKTIDSLRLVQDDVSAPRKRAARRSAERAEIAPMITTHWGQGAPYNNMCPEVNGDKCLTGCVATAMAQIMNYHKWPQGNTAAIDAYTTSSQGINVTALEASTFDWNNMKDEYYNVSTTDAEKEAVAKLMRYCGQAVNMDYGLEASGASTTPVSFSQTFGYSKSVTRILPQSFTPEELGNAIYEELENKRPILYSGHSASSGHAFIVDGYKDSYYHVNWGWNGDSDGYFTLIGDYIGEDVVPFEIIPYSRYQDILQFIQSPVRSEDILRSKVIIEHPLIGVGDNIRYRSNKDSDFPSFRLQSHLSSDLTNVALQIGYGLYDGDNLIQVLSSETHSFSSTDGNYYSYDGIFMISSSIPEGTYQILPINRISDNEEWMIDERSNINHIIAEISDKTLVLKTAIASNDGDFKLYGLETIDGITYELTRRFNNYRASVRDEEYSGDIKIPNVVEYDNLDFYVNGLSIVGNDKITSLYADCEGGIRVAYNDNIESIVLNRANRVSISDCPLLKSIDFPETISEVWGSIVERCDCLKAISFKGTSFSFREEPNWGSSSLPALTDIYFYTGNPPRAETTNKEPLPDFNTNVNVTIHVPAGCYNSYKYSQWKNWNIVDDLPANNFITWGYCHDDAVLSSGSSVGMGDNNVEVAMRVLPDELEKYVGCKITHIQVYSPERAINDYGDENYEYVFITKPGIDYLIKQPFSVVRSQWNTIELSEPYIISGDELYVGVGKHGTISVNFSDDTYVWNAQWVRAMGNDNGNGLVNIGVWNLPCPKDMAHPLPLRFVIQGEDIPEGVVLRETVINGIDGASARAFNDDVPIDNSRRSTSNVNMQGVIRNRSLDVIDSYTVTYSIDGGEPQTKEINTTLLPNATEQIVIDLPESLNDGKNHTVSTDVTMVNSSANGLMNLNMPIVDIVKLWGDVNGDNSVSVSDVINTISHVLKDTPNLFIRGAAQMNDDDEISVTDVIGLINLALGSNPSRQLDEINMEVE